MSYEILIGDVMERILGIPDNSVHCVITSPPYYGLRDYDTGKWVGGNDPDCDHLQNRGVQGKRGDRADRTHTQRIPYKGECGRCGAKRVDEQIGLEETPQAFIEKLVAVFREVRRVLRPDGTCWVNMGDSYASSPTGSHSTTSTLEGGKDTQVAGGTNRPNKIGNGYKPKDLMGMPWRLAFALQDDGWWLRADIVWNKPNPMPGSYQDRPTTAHEYVFLLSKSARYFYDAEAIKEPSSPNTHERRSRAQVSDAIQLVPGKPAHGLHQPRERKLAEPGSGTKNNGSFDEAMAVMPPTRNKRSVWTISTEAFPEAHFATFPTKLVEPCILAGTSEKGCCAKCGSPWVRATEKYDTGAKQKMSDGWDTGEGGHGTVHREGREAGESGKPVMASRTIGWEASCTCGAEVIPCTVLDPFNGSGTTGVVALKHRCDYIGIELSPEYAAMAERRLANASAQGVLL